MAVGDTYVSPGSLTRVLAQLFFPKPPTTFLTCFCRGERRKYAEKKSRLNRGSNSRPPGHESDTLTTEPPGQGPVQIECICRRQYKCDWQIKVCYGMGRKCFAKRRKCWLPAFLPISTMFSKAFFFRVVKSLWVKEVSTIWQFPSSSN